MSFTEIKNRNGSAYYYRTRSHRKGGNVIKERKYLGKDLTKEDLERKEKDADIELKVLSSLLSEIEMKDLEKIKNKYRSQSNGNRQNRYETFISMFTHDSTAIEGNTLTLVETASIIFDGITPPRGQLREINEVINHKKGSDYILSYEDDISRKFILKLHELVVKDTLSEDVKDQIGRYRSLQVFIRGVEWVPPSPYDVPKDMKELLMWYTKNKEVLHPLILASYFHAGFETVHPFIDGNGRVGRLLLNFILHKNGYPMINIPNSRKLEYYEYLEKGQVDGDLRPFIEFMLELLRSSVVLF